MAWPIFIDDTKYPDNTEKAYPLIDCMSCHITEERNGAFELELTYPLFGEYANKLACQKFIVANYNGVNNEEFRIYSINKQLDGAITVNARHISYDLLGAVVMPFEANGMQDALQKIQSNILSVESPISFGIGSDITSSAAFKVEEPTAARSLIGGVRGSLLDVYGGELQFVRGFVTILKQRGKAHKIPIRYGLNLASFQQDENCEDVFTGVYPYLSATETRGSILPPPSAIAYSDANIGFDKIQAVDFSDSFDEGVQPTESQLSQLAKFYVTDHAIGVPKVSIELSYVQLDELNYESPLKLCDTVPVEFAEIGTTATAKVMAIDYDVLAGRTSSLTLGTTRATIVDTIIDLSNSEKEETSTKQYYKGVLSSDTFSGITWKKYKNIVTITGSGAIQKDLPAGWSGSIFNVPNDIRPPKRVSCMVSAYAGKRQCFGVLKPNGEFVVYSPKLLYTDYGVTMDFTLTYILNEGENVETTNISNDYFADVTAYKYGNVVTITCSGTIKKGISTGWIGNVFTVPQDLLPDSRSSCSVAFHSSGGDINAFGALKTNGEFILYIPSAVNTSMAVDFTLTYQF